MVGRRECRRSRFRSRGPSDIAVEEPELLSKPQSQSQPDVELRTEQVKGSSGSVN
jgi:hypothetical protein